MKTYYDLLGIPRQANLIDIERGYRTRINAHMSRYGSKPLPKRVQARLQALRMAFLVLSSPSRREAYDRDIAVREQRLGRRIEIIGTLLGVSLLSIGLALIMLSSYQKLNGDSLRSKSIDVRNVTLSLADVLRSVQRN